ncbi:MAG: prephenate dehydrogenase [Erysipelotrichaceae bacterium]|nr:prephenate dehydrogenase [Erysipelotrichaceae bacterium]
MINKDTKFLIVGLGLIGGSYAKGLHKNGYTVYALAHKQSDIDYALKEGFIDKGSAEVDKDLLKEADVIIVSLYPVKEVEWLKENQQYIRPGTLITDVCGIKSGVIDVIQDFLREDLEMIACHPMAGKEVYGVINSDEKIFEKANYIVVPTEKNTNEAIEDAKKIGEILNFANISTLSVEEHDNIIGFVSQLTHILAVTLMTCNEDEHLEKYTGDSFRDLTRIARINENMWTELFIMNKKALLEQITSFEDQLSLIKRLLIAEESEDLKEIFRKSTKRRALFDKK